MAFKINGIDADRSGGSVSSAGDVNGDGFDDITLGLLCRSQRRQMLPESYVVFGQQEDSVPTST